jgi:alkylhydroperoxidase/carboxymuconolactone decarboxylase family protein YurZ
MSTESPGTWSMDYPKYRWNQIWEQYDPDKLALYQQWSNTMLHHRELPPKVREFIFVAVDAIVAWPSPYIDGHIHAAFDNGATVQELVEVIEVAGYLMGVHALNHGLTSLEKVVEERRAAGRSTPRDAEEVA